MSDVARVTIEQKPDDEQEIFIEYLNEEGAEVPEQSDAMLTANLMVALYKTMLVTQGIETIVAFVKDHEHIWSEGYEPRGEGESIWGK